MTASLVGAANFDAPSPTLTSLAEDESSSTTVPTTAITSSTVVESTSSPVVSLPAASDVLITPSGVVVAILSQDPSGYQ
ncbi:MAG: hypothetical protein KDB69_01315, partial [Acidimicrobiia bacterium]|nr:hypothetical protein [Acidimicrobiia bacterium]